MKDESMLPTFLDFEFLGEIDAHMKRPGGICALLFGAAFYISIPILTGGSMAR
jgi:hypothetical protein